MIDPMSDMEKTGMELGERREEKFLGVENAARGIFCASEASAKNFGGFKMPRGAFSREERAFFLSFVLLLMMN